ncbi:hypothetical protein F5876DRAFT_83337 [Lentinula aff. lateritia]|uniref:Uncharacterized protein n=1 Tax=Lentinula aff. lateritia TaxID=2804960 RepID=A0ACC1THZ2_9AGAR|nr:hypothetical protein F5876DRAFT_83337 [Lentinula aff. lateritia]
MSHSQHGLVTSSGAASVSRHVLRWSRGSAVTGSISHSSPDVCLAAPLAVAAPSSGSSKRTTCGDPVPRVVVSTNPSTPSPSVPPPSPKLLYSSLVESPAHFAT